MTEYNYDLKTLGKTVLLLRASNSITQRQLAKEMCVATIKISDIENGREVTQDWMIEKLANFFGVTPKFLIGQEEKNVDVEKSKEEKLDELLSNEDVEEVANEIVGADLKDPLVSFQLFLECCLEILRKGDKS